MARLRPTRRERGIKRGKKTMKFQDVLLSPNGRINRQPYWIATLVMFGASVVANFIPVVNLLFGLFSIYVYVCIYNKRLHDLGKSGWLQLITWIAGLVALGAMIAAMVPMMTAIMSGQEDQQAIMTAMFSSVGPLAIVGIAWLICLAFHIWLGVVEGQKGANDYGPDPLGGVDEEVFQ
jgi:uncharacterized membrane protein YhaH (DUF805 family)